MDNCYCTFIRLKRINDTVVCIVNVSIFTTCNFFHLRDIIIHCVPNRYGRYMGTLLCPWDDKGRCDVETWSDFQSKRQEWVDQVSGIVQSDRDWERHCVLMNDTTIIKKDRVEELKSMEKSMSNQPFPDPRPLHYLMVDRNIRMNMKTNLESALMTKQWRSRAADWFTCVEKANASRKWDSVFRSGGDFNPNSKNNKLLHKLLDKISSGQLNTGVNEETREQIDHLLETLDECMPQRNCRRSQDNSKLDWRKYNQVWANDRLQKIKSKKGSSLGKYVELKSERMELIDNIRNGLSESQLIVFNKVVTVTNPEGRTPSVNPLRMFAHGGPGTGKSHLIKKIKAFGELYGKSVKCMSISGCAAKIIGGVTCHSASFIVNRNNDDESRKKCVINMTQVRPGCTSSTKYR